MIIVRGFEISLFLKIFRFHDEMIRWIKPLIRISNLRERFSSRDKGILNLVLTEIKLGTRLFMKYLLKDLLKNHFIHYSIGSSISCIIDGNENFAFVSPGMNKNLDVYATLFLGKSLFYFGNYYCSTKTPLQILIYFEYASSLGWPALLKFSKKWNYL